MIVRTAMLLLCIISESEVQGKRFHKPKDQMGPWGHTKPHWKNHPRRLSEPAPVGALPFDNLRGSSGSRLYFNPDGFGESRRAENIVAHSGFIQTEDKAYDTDDAELVDHIEYPTVSIPMLDSQKQARNMPQVEHPLTEDSGEEDYSVNPFIVGGEETDISLYPFIVSLQFKGLHQCAGIILTKRIILTAAHCVPDMLSSTKNWFAVAGSSTQNDGSGQKVAVEVAEQHPAFVHTKKYLINDLAIIWLKGNLEWTETVKPAKLVQEWKYAKDELVTVIGWGKTSSVGTVSNVLRKVTLAIRGDEYCLGILRNQESKNAYGPTMFCTREKGKDTCNGDSGGPVVSKDTVVGIVSHGLGTCGATAAWNSKVSSFRDWIEKKLQEGPLGLQPEARAPFKDSLIDARSASLVQVKREPYIQLQERLETTLGEEVDVVCNVLFSGPATVFWTKMNRTDFFQEGSVLTFENVSVHDAGYYKCHAQMPVDDEIEEISAQTLVLVRHKPGVATITPDKPTAVIGSSLKLLCTTEPEGYPKPKFAWKKIGADQVVGVTSELIIKPVKQSTLGTYTCQASNELGSGAVAYFKVKIVQPVQVVKPLVSTGERIAGEKDFSMTCAAAGNPAPVVIWFKDGEQIDLESSIYKIVVNSYNLHGKTIVTTSKLTFRGQQRSGFDELELEDSGNYSCVFENEAERKETKRHLGVIERPKPEYAEKPKTDHIFSCVPGFEGKLYPHPSRCEMFVQCVHGKPLERPCSPGTAFSPTLQVCVWPNQAGCDRYRTKEKDAGRLHDVQVIRAASASARSTGSSISSPDIPGSANSKCVLPLVPGNITDSALFFGNAESSRTEYDSPPSVLSTKFHVALSFKTTSVEGIFFYIVDSVKNGFVGVFLKGGKVHFSFNNAGFLHLTSPLTYNDNEWHNLTFSRQNQTAKLVVDSVTVAEGIAVQSTGSLSSAIIFLGGVRPSVFQQATANMKGINRPLGGCISNFSIDNQLVTEVRLTEFTVPCKARFERGSYFPVNGGYLKTAQLLNVGVNFTLSLQIKPRTRSGVLAAVRGPTDYLVLQLVNGSVVLNVNNGNGQFSSTFTPSGSSFLCDGNWHTVEVSKRRHLAFLSVDGIFAEMGMGSEETKETNTNQPLHIGGHPYQAGSMGIKTAQKYVGCIQNISINQQLKEQEEFIAIGDVLYDCPTT